MTPSSNTIILNHPEDWEPWWNQLRIYVHPKIWPHINPDEEAPDRGLLTRPSRPEFQDFSQNANTYAQLSAGHQKAYSIARKHYDQDVKYFDQQEERLRDIRWHISAHVSAQKKFLLDPDKSIRQWLVILKANTEPTNNYMMRKIQKQYSDSLKGLKPNRVNQWIDQWEHAMILGLKYQIPQMKGGVWLIDLAQAVRPLNEVYYVMFTKQADKPEKSEPTQYSKVALELREVLSNMAKKTPTGTAKGSTFNTDFGDEEHTSEVEDSKGKRSRSRKRAGTNSIEEESTAAKRPKSKCLACKYKGHTLQDCWMLFENKRPEGYKLSKAAEARAKKAKERVAQNKELAAQVEER